MKLKALFGAGLAFARKHEGTILTALSMTTTVAAVYFAMKDSGKIAEALDKIHNDQEMSKLEKARTVLKPSARMLVATGASLGFQIANHKFAANTITSLTNAVTMYKTLNDEKDKVTAEVVGEEKAEEIRSKVAENRAAESYSMFDLEKAEITGDGNDLLYFEYFDKWFYGSYNKVETVVNQANRMLNSGGPVSVNALFSDLHLKQKPCYNALGWKEYEGQIEISPVGDVNDENRPYITICLSSSSRPEGIGARRW